MERAAIPRRRGLPAGAPSELSAVSGLPLETFRAEHVAERVERALAGEDVATVEQLSAVLRRDAGARERFRRAVAVSHSGFFRDPEQFELLEQRILPRLLEHVRRVRA